MEQKKKVRFRKWWREARPSKTAIFWSCVASAVLTIVVGFVWGGWVTGSNAQRLARETAQDAVVERLVSICVAQFSQDPGNGTKLAELKEVSNYQRDDYVSEQGWATMADEERPNRKVVDGCVELLMQIDE
jgi:hypothetical protein